MKIIYIKFLKKAKSIIFIIMLFIFISINLFSYKSSTKVSKTFPYNINYPGCIKPNHVSQASMNNSIKNYFNYWKKSYIKSSNGNTKGGGFYVEAQSTGWHAYPVKSNSEAHGFGMIILALMGEKKLFDGFYNMYDKHRSTINRYNMSWVITVNEHVYQDSDSATDGDMDIAYALLLAHSLWGSNGSIDYLKAAKWMITLGLKNGDMSILTKRTKLGDWSSSDYNTRSSDWMTCHMYAYYQITKDDFWIKAIDSVYKIIEKITLNYSPETGLMPDFIVGASPRPAWPGFLEGENDGNYYYNACRYPWRISMGYAMTGSVKAKKASNKIINWLKTKTGNNPRKIKAGYDLSGKELKESNYLSAAFVSPFISACVVDKAHQKYLNDGWDLIKNMKESYYEDSINLLCMLFISGNWYNPRS